MKAKKNMKAIAKNILKAAALVVIIGAFGTCDSLVEEPTVSFDNISLTGLNFTSAEMMTRINIQNNNDISIPFPEINWSLFIADELLTSGIVPKGTEIAANDSTTTDLPFSVPYEGLYNTIKTLLSDDDETPYRIDLSVSFSLPVLGKKTFEKSFDGIIPLPKLPELTFVGITFNTISLLEGVNFDLTWLVGNRNSFGLNLDKLNYNFAVNNTPWASGEVPPNTSLPARESTKVSVNTSVSSLSLISNIVSMIGGTANYTCGADISLSHPEFADFTLLDGLFNFPGSTNIKK